MKKQIISFIFFIFFIFFMFFSYISYAGIVCQETEYEIGFKSNLPTIDGKEIIQTNNVLFPNGKIKCQISLNYKTHKNNIRMKIEEGIYEGIKYQIYYSDGSGCVQGLSINTLSYVDDKVGTNWSIKCKLDEMDDTHWCTLDREDLRVGIWKDGIPFVIIGSNHFPNSKIAIRIDKNKPISASEKSGFTKAQSLKIITQLKKGKSVLTRYQEWPYQNNKNTTMELFGFPQAWAILQKIHKSVKSPK